MFMFIIATKYVRKTRMRRRVLSLHLVIIL